MTDPESLRDQLELCALNVLGQMFIYLTLAWIGPIYLALFTTTRKIFSVLASIIFHGHSVGFYKIGGITTVSVGILVEAILSIRHKTEAIKKAKQKKD
jgi:UDP-galactose transporter B1